MDRQTLRDWVIRFNEQRPDGLIKILPRVCRPSSTPRTRHFSPGSWRRARFRRSTAWRLRACDLIMRLHEEFGLSVPDDTIYRALKDLGLQNWLSRTPRPPANTAGAFLCGSKPTRSRCRNFRVERLHSVNGDGIQDPENGAERRGLCDRQEFGAGDETGWLGM
jgi:hypothetical protein